MNRFHPISDAVNSNQRSFPFGLWQTIGLITDRDKARAVAICARISDVPNLLPFLSALPRFLHPIISFSSFFLSPFFVVLSHLHPPSKSTCTDRGGTHASALGYEAKNREDGKEWGKRGTIGLKGEQEGYRVGRRKMEKEKRGWVFSVR